MLCLQFEKQETHYLRFKRFDSHTEVYKVRQEARLSTKVRIRVHWNYVHLEREIDQQACLVYADGDTSMEFMRKGRFILFVKEEREESVWNFCIYILNYGLVAELNAHF